MINGNSIKLFYIPSNKKRGRERRATRWEIKVRMNVREKKVSFITHFHRHETEEDKRLKGVLSFGRFFVLICVTFSLKKEEMRDE